MNMNLNKVIDLKNVTYFNYIFGRHDANSAKALSELLSVFLEVPVKNLIIKSPEITPGTKYARNLRTDIYCSIGEGDIVDIKMEPFYPVEGLTYRMNTYLYEMLDMQCKGLENLADLKETCVMFFLDFVKYDDDDIVHRFNFRSSDLSKFTEKDYITLITVELPKVKENPQTEQEKWAYTLKYCGDLKKQDKIEKIKKELEGVDLVMRIAQNISKDELEWLKEFDELRNKLDKGERVL